MGQKTSLLFMSEGLGVGEWGIFEGSMCDPGKFVFVVHNYDGNETGGTVQSDRLDYAVVKQQHKVLRVCRLCVVS